MDRHEHIALHVESLPTLEAQVSAGWKLRDTLTVMATVVYSWAEGHAGDFVRRWPVVESVQAMETAWDACCFAGDPEPVIPEGAELLACMPREERRRLEDLIGAQEERFA